MAEDVDFVLFLEDKEFGNEKNFTNFLMRNWSNKIKIGEKTQRGWEILLKINRHDEVANVPFYLEAKYYDKLKASALTFRTHFIDDSYYKDPIINYPHNPDNTMFYDIFFTACRELKPIYGYADETKDDERPCMDWAEYCKEPYLFCFEPPLFPHILIFGYNDQRVDKLFTDFIRNKDVIAKLEEIKEVMSRDELTDFIKKYSGQIKYSGKIVESDDGGIGILKNEYPQAAYPRYFIRRELRKRGIKLEEGLAEKYAKKLKMEEE